MGAGLLSTPVRVYAKTVTVDALGQESSSYTLWSGGTLWAYVRYGTGLSGMDVRLDAQSPNTGSGQCSVRIRQTSCSASIGLSHRLEFGGSMFEIMDVRPQGRGLVDFVCRKV